MLVCIDLDVAITVGGRLLVAMQIPRSTQLRWHGLPSSPKQSFHHYVPSLNVDARRRCRYCSHAVPNRSPNTAKGRVLPVGGKIGDQNIPEPLNQ